MENPSSIFAVASEYENKANFSFNFISKEDVVAEIKVLDATETIHKNHIPVKIIKTNNISFAEAICCYFNKSLENGEFPNCLKIASITSVLKKAHVHQKIIMDQLVFSLVFQRYLKDYLENSFQCSLTICYLSFSVVLERVTENNIVYY